MTVTRSSTGERSFYAGTAMTEKALLCFKCQPSRALTHHCGCVPSLVSLVLLFTFFGFKASPWRQLPSGCAGCK